MPESNQFPVSVPMLDAAGRTLAEVLIWPTRRKEWGAGEEHSLHVLSEADTSTHGEQPIQLRERERYDYSVKGTEEGTVVYRLVEQLGITPSPRRPNEGSIETGDFCGTLPLRLRRDDDPIPIATGMVEVRSMKLGYRKDYRKMLGAIAKETAALLMDFNSRTQNRLSSFWSGESPLIEQQLEFLRDTLESDIFTNALEHIFHHPHQRMEQRTERQSISRTRKVDRSIIRQLTKGGGTRTRVPDAHPLSQCGLRSVPRDVEVSVGTDFRNTAENRFIKMVVVEFRDFLSELATHLAKSTQASTRYATLLPECRRLHSRLEGILQHDFFADLSRLTTLPLGSPVLQRKEGYREIYRLWLQFHASAQLAWDGGPEIWHAGARNVATLYEYWIFFELVKLFRTKFDCAAPLHTHLLEKKDGIIRMKLKRGAELETPVDGTWKEKAKRRLNARFRFNHKFKTGMSDREEGSWTREVQPDYTISIWPADFTSEEAEKKELMVHVHFDAKYRVDKLPGFEKDPPEETEPIHDRSLGADQQTEETTSYRSTAAKYSDLLKMHAYRDAIRRTGGAYVLYPGNSEHEPLRSFYHEILPGLGAFAIRPGDGKEARGLDSLSDFLDKIIQHLSNRTTAYERSRFHLSQAHRLREDPVQYKSLELSELDSLDDREIAPPPEEHKILVVWSKDDIHLKQWEEHEIAVVRLGDRPGALRVDSEHGEVRHLLFRRGPKIFGKLRKLTKGGFTIYTGAELNSKFEIAPKDDAAKRHIYAVFEVTPDPRFDDYSPPADQIWQKIEQRHKLRNPESHPLNPRRSGDPQIFTLRDLLTTIE